MTRHELLIEHRTQGRFIRSKRITASPRQFILGSARQAGVRLMGEDIAEIHAAVEYREGHWVLMDLSGRSNVMKEGVAAPEWTLEGRSEIVIGGHELSFCPREISDQLFLEDDNSASPESNGDYYHQAIMRLNGQVVGTILLDRNQPFQFQLGLKRESLAPPKSLQWTTTEFGPHVIQQRLVTGRRRADRSKGALPKPQRDPFLSAMFAIMALMFVGYLGYWFFGAPKEAPLPVAENKITRMIYDAKLVKKAKEKSQAIGQKIATKGSSGGSPGAAPTPSGPEKSNVKPEVSVSIKKMQAAGLSQLIGRISKRAGSTGRLAERVVSNAPQVEQASPGFAGSKLGGGGILGGKTGKSFAGISTKGKGGGGEGYRGTAGLLSGGVGTGIVEGLEEETSVEGGLDKEVIAKYIESQLNEIRYCYERQLSAQPDLYGKLKIEFVIGASGEVEKQEIGKQSTLNNSLVHGCILRRVAKWKFPAPRGGTKVVVSYPLLFKSMN